ncbi:MAG: VOC family protein [Actinomycetota bacterium]|nr:VOC family protein [Actinomycetota bacterium]
MTIDAKPLVSRINVIYLYVREMGRSLAFYRDLLGIPLEGDHDWQEAMLGGTKFALHLSHERVGEASSGTIHVNFEVGDVDEAVGRLQAAGVAARETMREEYGVAYELVDPDGYRIYLFEPRR